MRRPPLVESRSGRRLEGERSAASVFVGVVAPAVVVEEVSDLADAGEAEVAEVELAMGENGQGVVALAAVDADDDAVPNPGLAELMEVEVLSSVGHGAAGAELAALEELLDVGLGEVILLSRARRRALE